ncbi:MAG: hypothetical protein RRC07_08170, partial [Anaerolineae bacterium]|nr:hypothetical protein [Anaerolineae bacterium]
MRRLLLSLFVLLPLVLLACRDEPALSPVPTSVAETPHGPPSREAPARQAKPETSPMATAGNRAESQAENRPDRVGGAGTWTILVYAEAGANGDQNVFARVDQMEAAELPDGVQVVVQLKGADRGAGEQGRDLQARRYLLAPVDVSGEIGSPVVAELGAVDMAEQQSLADFIAWGTERYPAEHMAVWLWSAPESLSRGDLESLSLIALRRSLEQALPDGQRLEVIAIDANRSADIGLLAAVAPFAHYAVVAGGLPPEGGLDYGSLLAEIAAQRPAGGEELAPAMVRHTPADGNMPFSNVAAVALADVGPLLEALDGLGSALQADMALSTAAVAAARTGAQMAGMGAPVATDRVVVVDLAQFSALLAQFSPDLVAAAAAAHLQEAVNQAVIPTGDELAHVPGSVSLQFPLPPPGAESEYQAFLPPNWTAFQRVYREESLEGIPAPRLSLLQVAGASGGALQPVFMGFELSGYNIGEVWEVAWRLQEGGARLVAADLVLPL